MARKITKEAVAAFLIGKEYHNGNTVVNCDAREIVLRLHGNAIAMRGSAEKFTQISVSAAGWNTTTTRERLNGLPGVFCHTRRGDFYLNGKVVSARDWHTITLA